MAPLLGFAAESGTGKTTLLKRLIPSLVESNIRVGLIKHSHHNLEIDKPGKDSYELRKAGALQTLVASSRRWALMTETPEEKNPDLNFMATRMNHDLLDLILVEGFKKEPIPKIVLFRSGIGYKAEDLKIDEYTIAVASDVPIPQDIRRLDLNNISEITAFVAGWATAHSGNKDVKLFNSSFDPENWA